MEWITVNWFFILVLVFCIGIHMFGHGHHGGHGHDKGDSHGHDKGDGHDH